jgi:hypothetical protein
MADISIDVRYQQPDQPVSTPCFVIFENMAVLKETSVF